MEIGMLVTLSIHGTKTYVNSFKNPHYAIGKLVEIDLGKSHQNYSVKWDTCKEPNTYNAIDLETISLNPITRLVPFNINNYQGKELITKDGFPLRIITSDRQSEDGYSIVALVDKGKTSFKEEHLVKYKANGCTIYEQGTILIKEHLKVGYVIVSNGKCGNKIYTTSDKAKNACYVNECVSKIEWYE